MILFRDQILRSPPQISLSLLVQAQKNTQLCYSKDCRHFGFIVNTQKCVIGTSQVEFFNYLVDAQGTAPTRGKVKPFTEFSILTSLEQCLNFCCRFLPDIAMLAVKCKPQSQRLTLLPKAFFKSKQTQPLATWCTCLTCCLMLRDGITQSFGFFAIKLS